MAAQDRTRWDNIYRKRSQGKYPAPDPLLLQYTQDVSDPTAEILPRALDLAAGFGQNGLWLAEQGYAVDVMDISRVALRRARAEMGMRNIRTANLLQVDLDELALDVGAYNLICVFRYLKRNLFSLMKLATKPGGRIIYETFNVRYLELVPEFNQDFLLEIGELRGVFMDWQVLHYEEETHITRLVAVRPR